MMNANNSCCVDIHKHVSAVKCKQVLPLVKNPVNYRDTGAFKADSVCVCVAC